MKTSDPKSNLIKRVLESTTLNQLGIAQALSVSAAQVSRWKNGEAIPEDRKRALKELAGIAEGLSQEWESYLFNIADNYLDKTSDLFWDNFSIIGENFVEELAEFGLDLPLPLSAKVGFVNDALSDSPLDDLAHDYLDCYQKLEAWYEEYMLDVELPGDVFEKGEDIRERFSYLAWQSVSTEVLQASDVDVHQLTLKLELVRAQLKCDLYDYCRALNDSNTNFRADYHVLLADNPAEACSHYCGKEFILKNRASSSADFLPYGYSVILGELNILKSQMTNLEALLRRK